MSITSERIKEIRTSIHMTQETLAKLVGMKDKSSISKIENPSKNIYKKDRDMTISQLEKIAKALNTTVGYLMGWTDSPEIPNERTSELKTRNKSDTYILAADTGSVDDVLVLSGDTVDEVQKHRNALANKIRNSDYTEEQLEKIEDMIKVITR